MPCLFCGSPGPMSEEDVVPRWALRAIGATDKITFRRASDLKYVGSNTGVVLKLPGICRKCNNGWMSNLETTVQEWLTPMLFGEAVALAIPQQRIVTFWGVKTAVLFETAMRKLRRTTPLPASTFRHLYENRDQREPPPGVQAWLFRYDPNNPPGAPEKYSVSEPISSALSYKHPRLDGEWSQFGYFNSFNIRALGIQVFGQEFTGEVVAGRLSWMVPQKAVEPFLVSLWPHPDQVVFWPSGETVPNGDLGRFGIWPTLLNSYNVEHGGIGQSILAESPARAGWAALRPLHD